MSQLSLTKLENGFLALAFSNGGFSASAELFYIHLLEPFVTALEGFPTSLDQVAEFKQEPDSAHSDIIHLRLFCIDGSGHITVELFVEGTAYLSGSFRKNSVRLFMATEPMLVSRFYGQLKRLLNNELGSATLSGIET